MVNKKELDYRRDQVIQTLARMDSVSRIKAYFKKRSLGIVSGNQIRRMTMTGINNGAMQQAAIDAREIRKAKVKDEGRGWETIYNEALENAAIICDDLRKEIDKQHWNCGKVEDYYEEQNLNNLS